MSITWLAMAASVPGQPQLTGAHWLFLGRIQTRFGGSPLEAGSAFVSCETGSAMADYLQDGAITTLHNLSQRPVAELEADLTQWAQQRPMALIIPTLFSEIEGDALPAIVDELATVPYLDEVIIGLDRADAGQFDKARAFFDALPVRHRILWHDGPALTAVDEALGAHGLAPLDSGKGRNVWYSLGYFLASNRATVVAMHDADILTYSRGLLARLLYPLAHPTFGYAFAKGYYFRSDGDRLNGRVSRLLVTPLLRSLRQTLGPSDYLDYIATFRYPLAGEYAMRADAVANLRIPFDWGLEIGVLSEVYGSYTPKRICQVDLAGAYDHKHQDVSANDPTQGLHRMAIDIAKAFYRKLAVSGEVFTPAVFRTLEASFHRHALDLVDQYHHDAEMNGYEVDRRAEEQLVDVFAQAIITAGQHFLSRPMELPYIPNWSLVLDTVPDIFDQLLAAVEADNVSDL